MTETEKKALALLNEACRGRTTILYNTDASRENCVEMEAVCRAIEQHEAFRQEVSDALEKRGFYIDDRDLGGFIIAKPDPLVEVMNEWWDADGYASIETFRAALAARGLEVRKIGEGE